GYCVDPRQVRDKDGISTALMLAEMAACLRARGRCLLDVLDDLSVAHGVHCTDAFAIRVDDLSLIGSLMHRLRQSPPEELGGVPIERIDDLAEGSPDLPPTEGLRYLLKDRSRVIVRPSGTEPKLKVYLETIVTVDPSSGLATARAEAAGRLVRVGASMRRLTTPA
ncbi:MAG TPA: phospho-sugar mutase, partial [Dermatophilaceae bacterium]|nr:phospho-sugar mutase [Dermatophilaceae bacterium]